MQVQYCIDGKNWMNVSGGALKTNLGDSFQSATSPNFTLSLPHNAADEAYLGIRLVTAYDPSTGSPDYSDTTGMTYNNNSGNWRLDNLEFTGQAVPEPSSLLLCLVATGIGLVARRCLVKVPAAEATHPVG